MAPKTKNLKMSKSMQRGDEGYDTTRFQSAEAQAYCFEKIVGRGVVPERGIDLKGKIELNIQKYAIDNGWQLFAADPNDGVLSVVREFYANAKFESLFDASTMVRGKTVSFDEDAINDMFNLKHFPRPDDYEQYAEQDRGKLEEGWKELTSELVRDDFRAGDALYGSIPAGALNIEARAWWKFVIGRLIPTSNKSMVTTDRAVLIYCLNKGMKFDVGRFLWYQIKNVVSGNKTGLHFPSLVTALCKRAGVRWTDAEEKAERVVPLPSINLERAKHIELTRDATERSRKIKQERRKPQGESSSQLPMLLLPTPRSEANDGRLDKLESQMGKMCHYVQWQAEQSHAYRQWQVEQAHYNAQCMRVMARSSGVDDTQFPAFPPAPETPMWQPWTYEAPQPPENDA